MEGGYLNILYLASQNSMTGLESMQEIGGSSDIWVCHHVSGLVSPRRPMWRAPFAGSCNQVRSIYVLSRPAQTATDVHTQENTAGPTPHATHITPCACHWCGAPHPSPTTPPQLLFSLAFYSQRSDPTASGTTGCVQRAVASVCGWARPTPAAVCPAASGVAGLQGLPRCGF